MTAQPERRPVLLDATVLINLINMGQLGILPRLQGFKFWVPNHVKDEVHRRNHRLQLRKALRAGWIEELEVVDLAEVDNRDRQSRGAWEVEHRVPQAKGGTDHLNNLGAACWPCNLDKGTRTARTHHRAVAADRAARVSRRRWGIAGKAFLPANCSGARRIAKL